MVRHSLLLHIILDVDNNNALSSFQEIIKKNMSRIHWNSIKRWRNSADSSSGIFPFMADYVTFINHSLDKNRDDKCQVSDATTIGIIIGVVFFILIAAVCLVITSRCSSSFSLIKIQVVGLVLCIRVDFLHRQRQRIKHSNSAAYAKLNDVL